MPATDTLYSALGTNPCSVTLVLDEYTVAEPPVPLVSWYLTLKFMIVSSNMDWEGSQDTIAELQPFAPAATFGGGSGSATD